MTHTLASRLRGIVSARFTILLWTMAIGATLLVKQSCSQVLQVELVRTFSRADGQAGPRDWLEAGGWWVIAYLASGLALGLVTLLLSRARSARQQVQRNAEARRLADEAAERQFEAITSGQAVGEFVLYLRPFALDDTLEAPSSLLMTIPLLPRSFLNPARPRFEEYLAASLQPRQQPLICLGRPEGSIGAGRVETDDEGWRLRLATLAHAATGIALVPGAQPGIQEEALYLRRNGLLRKTIGFKPVAYPEAAWARAAEAYAEIGIDLPDWSRGMLSFRLYDSGVVHQLETWSFRFLLAFQRDPGHAQLAERLTGREDPG